MSNAIPTKLPYALEVFCGSGRLARELQKEGFTTIGFDHSANKDTPQCRVINVDLAAPGGRE
eukprot:3303594-Karenia_brevis.AAC.1